MNEMDRTEASVAKQIAQAASDYERGRTGQVTQAVTVVVCDETLVITLQGALSPAEKVLAQNPSGAAQVQEFHRQLFASSCGPLRQEIQRITGVPVREAAAEVEAGAGAVMHLFRTGAVVQVFLLAHRVVADSWSGSGSSNL